MPTPSEATLAKKEATYKTALAKWQESRDQADKAALDALAEDLRATRQAYREAGEAAGTRQLVHIQEGV